MNNRGWGLEAMILWCAVLGILLIVATVMINSSINNMYNMEEVNRVQYGDSIDLFDVSDDIKQLLKESRND